MPDYQTHEHDVLVIGAGGAGLRAAIEASAAGVSVGRSNIAITHMERHPQGICGIGEEWAISGFALLGK